MLYRPTTGKATLNWTSTNQCLRLATNMNNSDKPEMQKTIAKTKKGPVRRLRPTDNQEKVRMYATSSNASWYYLQLKGLMKSDGC